MSEWSEEPTPRRVRSPRRRRQQQVAPAEPATEDTALREQKCRDREIACAEREVACAEREVACADRESCIAKQELAFSRRRQRSPKRQRPVEQTGAAREPPEASAAHPRYDPQLDTAAPPPDGVASNA